MTKAIERKGGLTVGYARLGMRGGVVGSVRQEIHDGDTINVQPTGNFGVRLLSVDAPEISFQLPGQKRFLGLAHSDWELFLRDPFAVRWPPFSQALEPGLKAHLHERCGAGAATNHYLHALAAERAFEQLVSADLDALGQNEQTFQFFLAFAGEVIDRYGRLLGFINRNQPDADIPAPRPRSYNERMLASGIVSPYFIWPNLDPWRAKPSLLDAVIKPGHAPDEVRSSPTLSQARAWVQAARGKPAGIFAGEPLRLQPFEVRFLARRQPPDRWVIDLSKRDAVLIRPQRYYSVPNVEDRLFIPAEYVPLFVEAGWQRQH